MKNEYTSLKCSIGRANNIFKVWSIFDLCKCQSARQEGAFYC